MGIPQDIAKRAAEIAASLGSMGDHGFELSESQIADAIEQAIMTERQRCYDIVHCGCGRFCDLDEAADKIISS